MLRDEEIKRLYSMENTSVGILLEFYEEGKSIPFLTLDEHNLEREAFELTDSLFGDETDITFGYCAAAEVDLTVRGAGPAVKNTELVIKHVIEGREVPLGRFIVSSVGRERLKGYRDITAYDQMVKFDVDVLDWYNSLTFPLSLREFRTSLCKHIGVRENVPDYLPNDHIAIDKTVDAQELLGRDVLQACEEVNGCFGHFDRYGVLQHVVLPVVAGLYPAPDLHPGQDEYPNFDTYPSIGIYPMTDIYPGMDVYLSAGDVSGETDLTVDGMYCRDMYYEDYAVKAIDKVQIRYESGDIGCIYGVGSNCYVVEGNFLLFGKNDTQLREIAGNLYGFISKRMYVPYECTISGAPYIDLGDSVQLLDGEDIKVSYVFKRSLSGLVNLQDKYQATGNEYREQNNSVNKEIVLLKNKALYLVKTVDEVSAHIIDVEKNTEAQFKITADQISAEVKRAAEVEAALKVQADQISASVRDLRSDTESRFTQTASQITAEVKRASETEEALAASINIQADQIALKVSKGSLSSELSLESGQVKITGNRLVVESKNFRLDADGNAVFSGTVKGARIYCKGGQFEADDESVYIGGFYTFSTDYGNYLASGDQSSGIGDYGRYTFWSGWDGRQADETSASSITSHYGVCISDQAVFIKDDAYIRGCGIAQGSTRLWGIGETVDWLNSKINALAGIIDDQWSDYTGVRSALRDWEA